MNKGRSDLKIRVKYKFKINGEVHEGIEEEASWYLFDQRGGVYTTAPMKPIPIPCGKEYDELVPLIKIKGKYMSVYDIETMLDDLVSLGFSPWWEAKNEQTPD